MYDQYLAYFSKGFNHAIYDYARYGMQQLT